MTQQCTWAGCAKPVRATGLCGMHYERSRRGAPMDARPRDYGSLAERFWPKLERTQSCWLWTASKNAAGYGLIGDVHGSRLAHRISWEIANGPIPAGLSLDHICHVRACVNPAHLRLATHATNNQNRSGATRASKSGIRGVRHRPEIGKWEARARLDGALTTVGMYETAGDAERSVTAWRRKHMPYSEMDKKEPV